MSDNLKQISLMLSYQMKQNEDENQRHLEEQKIHLKTVCLQIKNQMKVRS